MALTLRGLKGSALTHAELDNNFIFLKGRDIVSAGLIGCDLTFTKDDGNTITINLSGCTGGGGGSSSGDTYITTGYTQNNVLYLFRNDAVTIEIPYEVTYTNPNLTPITIGGVEAGSTFSGQTMQQMWDDLLYPDLVPAFTSFNMTIAPTVVDVGYTVPSGATSFTWSTSNSSFIQANSIEIRDLSVGPTVLFTGLTNDGSEPYVLPFNIQHVVPASYTWEIRAKRTNNLNIYRYDISYWRWRILWGNSSLTNLTASDVSGLTSSSLNSFASNVYPFPFAPGTYKHLCFPNTLWTGSNIPQYIRDNLTGFNMAMATPADGYSTNDGYGWYYDEITSVPNVYGFTTSYRCYRSKYQLGGYMEIDIN